MVTQDLREVIVQSVSSVYLLQIRNRSTHDERVEDHVLDAFDVGGQRHDAGSTHARLKALRCQTWPDAALGVADGIITPQHTEPQVVYGWRTAGFGVAER